MTPMLYGVYGGYYALSHLSFYEQVMDDHRPHDQQVFTWDMQGALAEMQDYQARGYDYVMLIPMPWMRRCGQADESPLVDVMPCTHQGTE